MENKKELGWGFLIKWMIAIALAWSLWASLIIGTLMYPIRTGRLSWILIVITTLFSLAPGFAQWIVLRKTFHQSGKWIIATTGGIFLSIPIFVISLTLETVATELQILDQNLILLLIRLLIGIPIGITQWLFLRKRLVRAWLWIIANAVALPFSSLVNNFLDMQLAGELILGGAAYGAITGITLIWLFNQNAKLKYHY